MTDHTIILVSGAPGAGKTTLAVPLAQMLGFALISKDFLKETLFDSLEGPVGDLAYSQRIGRVAWHLLWGLAARCPQVILEANFRPHSAFEREQLAALPGRLLEVYCDCPLPEAARRYRERGQTPARHPAHAKSSLTLAEMAEFDRPVGMGPVITVDTTRPVDIAAVAAAVRRLLAAGGEG